MSKTIVIQSHFLPLPTDWLQTCIDTVRHWANINKFEYKFIDDELFNYVSEKVTQKTKDQIVVATDLARLKVLQAFLEKNYETVIWCDADFIIFNPQQFKLPNEPYALGREVWVQEDMNKSKRLSVNSKVHNAFMMFRKGNVFLDFYAETAEKLIMKNTGTMPPQFIGPKLLSALHNIAQCPVLETAGMLSPLVVQDIAKGGGEALELFVKKSPNSIHAANICNSLYQRGEYSTDTVTKCISALISDKGISIFNATG